MAEYNAKMDRELSLEKFTQLADALGDAPETVIPAHLLRRRMCRAFIAGDPTDFDGAVIQAHRLPTEPIAFGSDPLVLWDLLESVPGWEDVLVDGECAPTLAEIIERQLGGLVRMLDDVYHVMNQPVAVFRDATVRRLGRADTKLLETAPSELRDVCWEKTRDLLKEGVVACAIVSGEIVATALTSARSAQHAEIGVYTDQSFRRRGLATAAASIVVRRVQNAGLTPVWSTGEHNAASLRVAQKLGFQ
jgi:hypothetical protein